MHRGISGGWQRSPGERERRTISWLTAIRSREQVLADLKRKLAHVEQELVVVQAQADQWRVKAELAAHELTEFKKERGL